jgi:ribosomal protein S18 acetylase RimI-like enzyme
MKTERKIVDDIGEVQDSFQLVKSQNNGLLTNFFVDPLRHCIWIRKHELELIRIKMSVLLLHAKDDFKSLFFITSGLSELEECMEIFLRENQNERLVIDLVGTEGSFPAFTFLTAFGFKNYSTLVRMSSPGPVGQVVTDGSVSFAAIPDIPIINAHLQQYFDKYVDQLPIVEEFVSWVDKKQLLVYKDKDTIGGFLIFDSTITTAYLRYWFVHPDFREQKIGSKLIMQFFEINRKAKRYLFWVKEDNENAIKRYAHYGFKNENLKDLILTYNITQNER